MKLTPPEQQVETLARTRPEIVLMEDWSGMFQVRHGDWVYWWTVDGVPRTIVIPEGFITDLSSVPSIVWWWIPPWGLRQACLPHDLLYARQGNISEQYFLVDGSPTSRAWTRKEADQLFARIMREDGVPKMKRRAAYWAVRMGARGAWRRSAPTASSSTQGG